MNTIEIRNRFTGDIIFTHECADNTILKTVTAALAEDADLTGADLTGANLTGANLTYANLTGANLSDADLTGAYLTGADLSGAKLSGTNLSPIRDDIWAILSSAPIEVPALISALNAGKVDGSTYTGECACLVGTLAKVRGIDYNKFESLTANANRPAERFFMGIRTGDTPETSQFSKLAHDWCVEWLNNMQAAFGVKP